MKLAHLFIAALFAATAVTAFIFIPQARPISPAEWTTYQATSRTPRYSPLDQI